MEWLFIGTAVLAGAALGQAMRFQWALAEFAEMLATADNGKLGPKINYQNSITPPWLTRGVLLLLAVSVASALGSLFIGGWIYCIGSIAAVIASLFAAQVASEAASQPTFSAYVRLAFNNLCNREANYRRDGDTARANAAHHFTFLMQVVAGDVLRA